MFNGDSFLAFYQAVKILIFRLNLILNFSICSFLFIVENISARVFFSQQYELNLVTHMSALTKIINKFSVVIIRDNNGNES